MRSGDRAAALEVLERYSGLLRRHYCRQMGARMRRLFDTQDVLSTVLRRLDQRIRNGRIGATEEPELIALLHRIASGAIADRARKTTMDERLRTGAVRRAASMEAPPSGGAAGDERTWKDVLDSIPDERDRELLVLRAMGAHYAGIGAVQDADPALLRKRMERMVRRLGDRFSQDRP